LWLVCIAASFISRPAPGQHDVLPGPSDAPPAALVVAKTPQAHDCPDAAMLAQSVAEITGRPSLVTAPRADTRLSFHVELAASSAGYVAVIRASGSRSGIRRIADIGSDCVGLAHAVAVTLAIIVDDERAAPAEPVPASADWAPPQRQPERPSGPVWRPYALVVGSLGALESPAAGPSAGVGVELGSALVGIDVFWLLPRTFELSPGEIEVSLLAVSAYGCWRSDRAPRKPWYAPCVHVSAGSLAGSAAGFTKNRSAQRPWVAPGLGVLAGGPLVGSLEWLAQGKLFVPVHAERFVIDNVGPAHETPPLGGLLGLGLSLVFQ
jgi:hypothetical protein